MATEVEELAQRVSHLEGRYDGIVDDVKAIKERVDMLYEKSERDKTELKTEFVERIETIKTEFIERIETTKTDLIKWMVGISATFTVIIITAIWAILTFAIPTKTVLTESPTGNSNEIIEKTIQPPVE